MDLKTNQNLMKTTYLDFNELKIASISDIHLFHKKTTTQYIINNLNKYLVNDEFLCDINILFIAGDLFDDGIMFNNEDTSLVTLWVSKLLHICKRNNVTLRILEGTPSHDRNQSKIFLSINELLFGKDGVDLKYIKTLSIEYIDKYNINVLYVPDEWNHDNADTLIEVKQLLYVNKLEQVDFAIMHGQFEYQMPEIVNHNVKHDSSEYLKIVKHLIFIGHIHQHSSFDRIYSHGSFDRLRHGEEEPKGFIKATILKDCNYKVEFIENKNAKTYKTVVCKNEDIDVTLNKLDKIVKKLNPGSFIKILTNTNNPIFTSLSICKERWPDIEWSMDTKDKDTENNKISFKDSNKIYVPIIINRESIRTLLLNKIKNNNLNEEAMEKCISHIADIERI